MSIDIKDVKLGDKIKARFGDVTIEGPVLDSSLSGHPDMQRLEVFGHRIDFADEILAHTPIWHSATVISATRSEESGDREYFMAYYMGGRFIDNYGDRAYPGELFNVEVIVP